MKILIVISILFILYAIIKTIKNGNNPITLAKNENNNINLNNYYYCKKTVFSQAEERFYNQLLTFIDNKYYIFTKVRLWDIFEVKNINNKHTYSNKIRSKHIDFVLCEKDGKYISFIELDDNSHYQKRTIKRDKFVNKLFYDLNYNLFRYKVSNNYNFEELNKFLMLYEENKKDLSYSSVPNSPSTIVFNEQEEIEKLEI